jgi:hypothetical protein
MFCFRSAASLSGLEVTVASALCEGRKPLTASSGSVIVAPVPCDTRSPSLPAGGVLQARDRDRDREEHPPLLSAVEVSDIIEAVRPLLLSQ